MLKNKKGFTLIELLIVIGIIAILAGIVLVAVNPAQQFGKANDSERKSEIGTILSAVYQFQTAPSARGSLPACWDATLGTPAYAAIPDCGATYDGAIELGTLSYDCDHGVTTLLVPGYLREVPIDPDATFDSDNTGYYICQTNSASPSTSTVVVLAPAAEVFYDDGGCSMVCDDILANAIPDCRATGVTPQNVMCVGS